MLFYNQKSELNTVSIFFIFYEKSVLLKNNDLPTKNDFIKLIESNNFLIEKEFDFACLILSSTENTLFNDFDKISLREYFSNHSEKENFLISRAYSLIKWKNNFNFCPKCSKSVSFMNNFSALKCQNCNIEYFPRIEPCIIVLVSKEDKILLVRHTYRNQDIYACIAGFIEAGESAESAVKREVFEEVGLKIKNIKFAGTQSWPFPDQLMLAYYAEYESGEIKIQPEEIADAKWFSKDNLPEMPKKGSVAYKLINNLF